MLTYPPPHFIAGLWAKWLQEGLNDANQFNGFDKFTARVAGIKVLAGSNTVEVLDKNLYLIYLLKG